MENKKIGVFLDAINRPRDAPSFIDEWVVCRNEDEFMETITKYWTKYESLPAIISFDHDLLPEHFQYTASRVSGLPIMYSTMKSSTGFHIAKKLVEFCRSVNAKLNKVSVHTLNRVGSLNIQKVINDFKKECGDSADCFTMNYNLEKQDK